MSADFTPEKEDIKILPPFKMQVLTNFPYIEADFDALTNYQLLCKVVEYLNMVINNENEVTEEVTGLYNAYVSLQNYVNNYFDNLDVQEEINNKLDEMVEDGTLQEIITTYIQSNVMWTFDSVSDMKSATNLINGSYAKTIGYYTKNDGGGAEYYITDTVDSNNYQESLGNGLYATLLNIKKCGYIDLRWLGADPTGTTDTSSIFATALTLSNKKYITPIKVIGKFLIDTEIDFIGSLALIGEYIPGSRQLVGNQNNPNAIFNPPSQIIINDSITAFKIAGLGDIMGPQASALYIKNIDFTSVNSSKTGNLIELNAWGAPSRPSIINACGCHGINSFIKSNNEDSANRDTLIGNLDIGNCEFYLNGKIFDIQVGSLGNSLVNCNIHDNVIEQGGGFTIQGLIGPNSIYNNILENLTTDIEIMLTSRGKICINNNYFEANDQNIDIKGRYASNNKYYSSRVTDVEFKDNYFSNTPNLNLNFISTSVYLGRNITLSHLNNQNPFNVTFTNCYVDNSIEYNYFNLQTTNNIVNVVKVADIGITTNSADGNFYFDIDSGTPQRWHGKNYNKFDSLVQISKTTDLAINSGDNVMLCFWKPKGVLNRIYIRSKSDTSVEPFAKIAGDCDDEGYYICILRNASTTITDGALMCTAPDGIGAVTYINLGQTLTDNVFDKALVYLR